MSIRWMTAGDIEEVAQTEREVLGYGEAFTDKQLTNLLEAPDAKMVVFRHDGKYAGHGIYLLGMDKPAFGANRPSFDIARCLVAPEVRRQGIGSDWIAQIKRAAASKTPPPVLRCLVSSKNLGGHLFAKAMGFYACQTVVSEKTGQEYYLFLHDPIPASIMPSWRKQGTTADFPATICG